MTQYLKYNPVSGDITDAMGTLCNTLSFPCPGLRAIEINECVIATQERLEKLRKGSFDYEDKAA